MRLARTRSRLKHDSNLTSDSAIDERESLSGWNETNIPSNRVLIMPGILVWMLGLACGIRSEASGMTLIRIPLAWFLLGLWLYLFLVLFVRESIAHPYLILRLVWKGINMLDIPSFVFLRISINHTK